jgi:hypothetical protein
MPFNSALPANGSPVSSAELRNQFNALKALIDAQAAQIADLQALMDAQQIQIDSLNTALASRPDHDAVLQLIDENAACAVDSVSDLLLEVSDPPAQGEVQQICDKVSELVEALKGGV